MVVIVTAYSAFLSEAVEFLRNFTNVVYGGYGQKFTIGVSVINFQLCPQDILIYALHIFLRLKSDGFVAVIVVIGANASGGYDKFVSIF